MANAHKVSIEDSLKGSRVMQLALLILKVDLEYM
jgi:hypothetical protein